ncbi:MAG: zinc ABC transporter substrate-binding protein [Tissierellia bacterium]|nr:zinc ABC transporter substrate-binding protein [Tissierellia bacterium]
MKRRWLIFLLGLSVGLGLLGGCSPSFSNHQPEGDRPLIYSSFYPIYSLTKMVVGDMAEVRIFMPSSATVHDWEPSPKDIRDLAKADLLLVNGAGMESWLNQVEEALPHLRVVALSDGAQLISYQGAALLGDFQLMQEGKLGTQENTLTFGHNHATGFRAAFYKKDPSQDLEDLVQIGRTLMEDPGDPVALGDRLQVESGKTYAFDLPHWEGETYFTLPEAGDWVIYTDHLYEEALPFAFQDGQGQALPLEIRMEGASQEKSQTIYDPHSWLSLDNAKAYMGLIYEEALRLMPENQEALHDRLREENFRLIGLKKDYEKKFGSLENRDFIVLHSAFEYLARDFDLNQYAIQGLTSMGDPSIKSLVTAIGFAQDQKIHTIYSEYGQSQELARTLAGELDQGQVVPITTMEHLLPGQKLEDWDYLDLMALNLENLYQGMAREKALKNP